VSRAGAAAGPLRGLRAAVVVSKEEARDRARARGTASCRCSSVAFSARAESTRGGDYARTCSRSGQLDIKAVEKAAHIVGEWNKAKIIDKPVQLNQPEIWKFISGERKGQDVPSEPFIRDYIKFNSNTGMSRAAPFQLRSPRRGLRSFFFFKKKGQAY
jgi:hypothetical protein